MSEAAGLILRCPSCYKETCRLCGDEGHVPLKCSEVEKKGQADARHAVEEAMTKARLRECHKCKSKFYKTEGCNKMTCSCGAFICYICRKDITKEKYHHFCQIPHCDHTKCGLCKLFTNSVEDDRVAMYEAGLQALQTAPPATGDQTNVPTIELGKLLEGGALKKTQQKQVVQRVAAVPGTPHAVRAGAGAGAGAPHVPVPAAVPRLPDPPGHGMNPHPLFGNRAAPPVPVPLAPPPLPPQFARVMQFMPDFVQQYFPQAALNFMQPPPLPVPQPVPQPEARDEQRVARPNYMQPPDRMEFMRQNFREPPPRPKKRRRN